MRFVTVRYSQMYYRGRFLLGDDLDLRPGVLCLVKSPRGIELGKVLSDPTEFAGEVVWLKNSKTHGEKQSTAKDCLFLSGEVIREATEKDLGRVQEIYARGTRSEEKFCKDGIIQHSLPMKLAGVEYLFEGEKIIFYFLADGRVDFRNLVKDLAKEYRTRIEMKQIGVRDEARLLAEYEHCGRRLCCKGFLNDLEPVTMKMAKSQKTTLDPSKISGRCGRLMCCLRYEDNVYKELRINLPRKGALVYLKSGKAKVLAQDIFHQKLLVETEPGVSTYVMVSELLDKAPEKPEPKKSGESRSSSRGGSKSGSRQGGSRQGGSKQGGSKQGSSKQGGRGGRGGKPRGPRKEGKKGEPKEANADKRGDRTGKGKPAGVKQGEKKQGEKKQGEKKEGQRRHRSRRSAKSQKNRKHKEEGNSRR